MTDLKHKDITEKIIGASVEMPKFLGNGLQACPPKGSTARRQEMIYQRALSWEPNQVGLTFQREIEQNISAESYLQATSTLSAA